MYEGVIYWKSPQSSAVRESGWKLLVHRKEDKVELYDIENDFREMNNLSEANPEKTAHLMELLKGFQEGDREK